MRVIMAWYIIFCFMLTGLSAAQELNLRPIIGILSQEPGYSMIEGNEDKNFSSYVAASYIKFMESAGARVAPIMINQNESYYDMIASSVNGILFPGGAESIRNDSGYGMAGQWLYERVMEKNSNGEFLPLWATCLGFEMLGYLAAGYSEFLADCSASNLALPLDLGPDYQSSDIFQEMPSDVFNILTTENVTANFHRYCYTQENFTLFGVSDDYYILSTNYDWDGFEFISTIEHKQFPIYGTQWHPEKNAYEWKNDASHDGIPHSPNSVYSVQYLADFIVSKARLNNQSFATAQDETDALIYNFSPTYVGNTSSSFVQVYFFK